jgi:hypothetical protein
MNYYLFVDNFRGFTNTCIPVADVNFLVGENSTGKSSVLGLLKLFSGPTFMMGQDFSGGEVGFGHYLDMVSAHSDDQSYFRIGFVSETAAGPKGEKLTTGCLYTFREHQGQPRLFKATFCRNKEEISIKFGNVISFKPSPSDGTMTTEDMIATMRSKWINEHSSSKDIGYSRLEMPMPGMDGRVPILIALSIARNTFARSGVKKGEFVFYPPDMWFSPPDLTWFGPIRTKAKRTYDELSLEFSPEGQHTPYLIRRLLRSKVNAVKLKEFIERVGKASGLFQGVKIQSFGRGATARFELDIVLDGKALNILNVGYGVSQSLPIIVELLARPRGAWFAIQEPEIHLHPRAQAAFGDVLFEMAMIDRKRFFVETHSDFMIDRFRMKYKNGRSTKPDSQILFFERRDRHNIITPLAISKTGELPKDQPESYRHFFIREQMDILGL